MKRLLSRIGRVKPEPAKVTPETEPRHKLTWDAAERTWTFEQWDNVGGLHTTPIRASIMRTPPRPAIRTPLSLRYRDLSEAQQHQFAVNWGWVIGDNEYNTDTHEFTAHFTGVEQSARIIREIPSDSALGIRISRHRDRSTNNVYTGNASRRTESISWDEINTPEQLQRIMDTYMVMSVSEQRERGMFNAVLLWENDGSATTQLTVTDVPETFAVQMIDRIGRRVQTSASRAGPISIPTVAAHADVIGVSYEVAPRGTNMSNLYTRIDWRSGTGDTLSVLYYMSMDDVALDFADQWWVMTTQSSDVLDRSPETANMLRRVNTEWMMEQMGAADWATHYTPIAGRIVAGLRRTATLMRDPLSEGPITGSIPETAIITPEHPYVRCTNHIVDTDERTIELTFSMRGIVLRVLYRQNFINNQAHYTFIENTAVELFDDGGGDSHPQPPQTIDSATMDSFMLQSSGGGIRGSVTMSGPNQQQVSREAPSSVIQSRRLPWPSIAEGDYEWNEPAMAGPGAAEQQDVSIIPTNIVRMQDGVYDISLTVSVAGQVMVITQQRYNLAPGSDVLQLYRPFHNLNPSITTPACSVPIPLTLDVLQTHELLENRGVSMPASFISRVGDLMLTRDYGPQDDDDISFGV